MPEYCIIISNKLLFGIFDASFITFERESMCIKHRVSEIYYRCISSSVLLFANNLRKWTWELLSIISVWLASMLRNWCKYFLRTLPWKSAIIHGSGSTWTKWLWWVSVSWKKFQEATFCKIIFFPCIVWTYMTFFHV